MAALLFGFAELARTVIGVFLVFHSAHRNEGEHNVSENESDPKERAFAADVQHAGKQRHQYAGNEESIREDLDVYRSPVREEALRPDHEEGDKHLDANTNRVFC